LKHATNPLKGLDQQTVARTIGYMLALTAILVASSYQSRHVNLFNVPGLGLPHGFNNLVSSIAYGAIALIGYYRVEILERRSLSLTAVALELAACTLLALAPGISWTGAYLVGLVSHLAVSAWATLCFAMCLMRLPDLKAASVTVVGGILLRQLLLPLYSLQVPRAAGVALMGCLCSLAILYLIWANSKPQKTSSHTESLGALELTNPLSNLLPSPRLYVCAFLVSLTYAFSNVFGVPGLSARRMLVVVALLVLLYYLLILKDRQEDNLFSLSVFCIVTGLVLSPLTISGDEFASHTFLFLGSTCFSILTWLLVWSLGNRSFVAAIPVFGFLNCTNTLGSWVGGTVGRTAYALANSTDNGAELVIAALALLFFAFMWFGFKQFSFTDAIRGVEVVGTVTPLPIKADQPPARAADEPGQPQTEAEDELGLRCSELLRTADLTPREAEVFELLARGRNAQYIMDTLCVTRNTAKTHIRHIYTKLGVHSHQELLSLIEGKGQDR